MEVRLAYPIQKDSVVDGEGLRTVIWFQGCSHNCKGCHNPSTHDFKKGIATDVNEILKELKSLKNQDGITLSGGDPLFQLDAALKISEFAHTLGLNVWCYTGFTFEEVLNLSKKNPVYYELLKNIDILVDGKFEIENKSLNCSFRGSINQRIIDVPTSISKKKTVLKEKYYSKLKKEESCIYI